jgi:hypothetical protein
MVQLVEGLPSKREAPSSKTQYHPKKVYLLSNRLLKPTVRSQSEKIP